MKVERKDIDKLNAEIIITVKEEDYKDPLDKALKNYRKQMNMPGFRKGHVPLGMVKKMVGTSLLVEEVNKLLQDKLYSYIEEEKIEILGNPLPTEKEEETIDWENQKEFTFTYDIGLSPEVKINLSENDKFKKYDIQVSDKMVKEQIDEMAMRFGKMVDVDISEKEDMLYGKFQQTEKGKIIEDGITNDTVLNIRTIAKEKDQKAFIGVKVGDVVKDIKPLEIAEPNYVASWLGLEQQFLPDKKTTFQYTVAKVSRMEPAKLNQDLFDKLYGKDNIKSKKALEEKVKKEINNALDQNSEQFFERDVQDYLLDKSKLKLPDEFLKRWLLVSNNQGATKEDIEADYENYALGIRWQLIENKLIKEHEIQVEQEEMINHTMDLVRQQLGGMGQNMMEDEDIRNTAMRVLQNQDEARGIYSQLANMKLREVYNKTVKITEEKISYDDFLKLADKKKKK